VVYNGPSGLQAIGRLVAGGVPPEATGLRYVEVKR
jgi:hypothetical protein